jgi:hypothetical protein
MPVPNKPSRGQADWDVPLNAALDYLDARIDDVVAADTADFVFDYVDEDNEESRITVANHDMVIRTTRTGTQDADIDINSADDVWIYANGDDIHLYAADDVEISTNWSDENPGAAYNWEFTNNGRLRFPDGTLQTTAYQGVTPPAYFLNWRTGTTHLPTLNTHFGWDSNGVWFTDAFDNENAVSSYPIFTDFTIAQNEPVIVEFDVDINSECSDMGVCVYVDGTDPEWDWDPNTTRIAAQFDCFNLTLNGRTTSETAEAGVPGSGVYTVTFMYTPTAETDKVTVSYKAQGSSEVIASLSLNEALPAGAYRVGFAADQDSSDVKTYMSHLLIDVNNGDGYYSSDLQQGTSGSTSDSVTTGDFDFNDNVMSTEDVNMRIQAKRDSSTLGAAIELDPYDGQVSLFGYSSPSTSSYSTSDWTGDATWSSWGEGGSQIVLTGAAELVAFLIETFNASTTKLVSINGSDNYVFDGFGGNSDEVTIYTLTGAPSEPTIVTSLELRYQTTSRIEIDQDDEEILIQGVGLDIKLRSTEDITFITNLNGDTEQVWTFTNDGNIALPVESPRISNNGVPGDITLSAYLGVNLAFADTEGAGLKFPDETLQTTAFVGGATGSFTSHDGKSITVTNGIITSIVEL